MKDNTSKLDKLTTIECPRFDGVFFDLGSVYEQAELVPDPRDPRGIRYNLALLLCLMLLAKLCGGWIRQVLSPIGYANGAMRWPTHFS